MQGNNGYNQYLNCSGDGGGGGGGDAFPNWELSAGFWEEKVTVFGRKNRLNFWIRPVKAFGVRRRPIFSFFGDHLFLAGKTVYIAEFGQKKLSDFGEDLFFFFFFFWDHMIFTENSPKSN